MFLKHLSPLIVEDPSKLAVEQACEIIHHNDAPILAAAIEASVDDLATWNTRHFQKKAGRDYAQVPNPDTW